MTPEAQRIAIAEACRTLGAQGEIWFYDKYDTRRIYADKADCVPDYLNDLNAMHEAEKVLSRDQISPYMDQTIKLLKYGEEVACMYMWHATAAQRAEAFLRTLGLWK